MKKNFLVVLVLTFALVLSACGASPTPPAVPTSPPTPTEIPATIAPTAIPVTPTTIPTIAPLTPEEIFENLNLQDGGSDPVGLGWCEIKANQNHHLIIQYQLRNNGLDFDGITSVTCHLTLPIIGKGNITGWYNWKFNTPVNSIKLNDENGLASCTTCDGTYQAGFLPTQLELTEGLEVIKMIAQAIENEEVSVGLGNTQPTPGLYLLN